MDIHNYIMLLPLKYKTNVNIIIRKNISSLFNSSKSEILKKI